MLRKIIQLTIYIYLYLSILLLTRTVISALFFHRRQRSSKDIATDHPMHTLRVVVLPDDPNKYCHQKLQEYFAYRPSAESKKKHVPLVCGELLERAQAQMCADKHKRTNH